MEVKDVIDRIGYFRTNKKLSARELSLRIEQSESYITRMESNEFNLTIKKLLKILNEFGVEPAEFFADNYMSYNTDNKLMNKFEKLKESDKRLVEMFIDRLKSN